jgi:hypothetical protein
MTTYAQSETALHTYGFDIYYELLPLDEALALERSSIQGERDVFGDEFDAHVSSQLKIVCDLYARGFVWGTAYSIRALPAGEFSSSILRSDLAPLSREQFDAARARGWLAGE